MWCLYCWGSVRLKWVIFWCSGFCDSNLFISNLFISIYFSLFLFLMNIWKVRSPLQRDSSQTWWRPSGRRTQPGSGTNPDRCCRSPRTWRSGSSGRTAEHGDGTFRWFKMGARRKTKGFYHTLEVDRWSAEVLSAHGTDAVEFTQLDVDKSQVVSGGQQWTWSSQHSAWRHKQQLVSLVIVESQFRVKIKAQDGHRRVGWGESSSALWFKQFYQDVLMKKYVILWKYLHLINSTYSQCRLI